MGSKWFKTLKPLVLPHCTRDATVQGLRVSKSGRSLGLGMYNDSPESPWTELTLLHILWSQQAELKMGHRVATESENMLYTYTLIDHYISCTLANKQNNSMFSSRQQTCSQWLQECHTHQGLTHVTPPGNDSIQRCIRSMYLTIWVWRAQISDKDRCYRTKVYAGSSAFSSWLDTVGTNCH